ncbi:transcriptional regulator, TetR family [Hoeflea sp. IMCC20628]|uniref:TetR family transcriptional regulator n=1 Tax=Hoeflea sp. IMCC20628 TaxID=1620421 RepID=UPI00063AA814|nr:TetR family transcriptional regulator [Hoeflea sp. IMCC20628]AKI00738.1 transcriptional regulator, TetR family [Hoeflea sp. IMCC20628]
MGKQPAVKIPRTNRKNSARRELIVRRAAELFDERGVTHTSIEEIASAIGVTREAIYYYFSDKLDILLEIIYPESVSLDAGLQRIMALEISVREKLVLAIENHLHRFNPNYLEMVLSVRRLGRLKADTRVVPLLNIWRRYQRSWIDLVADGQERGELPEHLDPKVVAYALLGMCNSPSTWFRPSANLSIDDLAATFVELILNGVLLRDPAAKAEAAPHNE